MMSGIRGQDTKPELLVRCFLHGHGFRYRLSPRDLPGKPDLVLPKHGAVVFVHGCFWHRHGGCRFATVPASNKNFWKEKFDANVARDKRVRQQLQRIGWKVIVVWECQLDEKRLLKLAGRIRGD
jgi:DNA mismatch endonuclease (patch repair protein)